MSANLDGNKLFDESIAIEAESVSRESIERSAAGLDGVLSIDLGGRGRKIRQKGEIRARSKAELDSKAGAISAFIDGNTHTLVGSRGDTFENLRVDSVNVKNERVSGAGVVADYEVVYTQLMV
ncbi:MAG: hypothetical protein ABSB25_01275 [Sedimentisphaerales bacterium]|jgi:hypothetical protein